MPALPILGQAIPLLPSIPAVHFQQVSAFEGVATRLPFHDANDELQHFGICRDHMIVTIAGDGKD